MNTLGDLQTKASCVEQMAQALQYNGSLKCSKRSEVQEERVYAVLDEILTHMVHLVSDPLRNPEDKKFDMFFDCKDIFSEEEMAIFTRLATQCHYRVVDHCLFPASQEKRLLEYQEYAAKRDRENERIARRRERM